MDSETGWTGGASGKRLIAANRKLTGWRGWVGIC